MQAQIFAATLLALFSTLAPLVSAHGYVKSIAVDGKWYAGNMPGQNTGPSPIRTISSIDPVKGATNDSIVCGLNAEKADMVVPANPGSVFSIQWSGGDGVSNWPHNIGPLMTYMASCGSTPCDQYDGTDAKWFKIDELGQKPNSDGTTWYQQDIMNGDSFDLTLPKNLAPGGYLIRHEIIALHLANYMGGAEFYPMCTQVMISGNGNGVPDPTVAFPGAYSDDDPGIYDPDVFNSGNNYTFPGGPVANLAATDASIAAPFTGPTVFPTGTAVSADPGPATTATTTPAAAASASGAGGSGSPAPGDPAPTAGSTSGASSPGSRSATCSLKARPGTAVNQKRHFGRFLRRALSYASR